jgi:GT2 family glycosyltransferase
MNGGDVSAIVVTYFTGPALDECLDAVLSDAAIDQLVLVDNGNPDAVAQRLRALETARDNVVLLQGHGNVGFAKACNLGARRATGAHLLFLNPDVALEPGAVAHLRKIVQGARAPAIVGGRLLDARGIEQRGARRDRLTLWRAFVSFTGLAAFERLSPFFRDLHRERDPAPDAAIPVGAVSGALFMTRRADFASLGGFDEGYFLHVEDFDLCRRAEEAGGAVIFAPKAEGVHARSTSDAPAAVVERHKAAGFARYFRKFAASPLERAAAALLGSALAVILPLRASLRRRGPV